MEQDEKLIQQAQEIADDLRAEITALAAEFNTKVKEAGFKAGVRLVTDIEIKILPMDGKE